MDDHRFDTLTRTLGQRLPRRGALGLLGGLAALGLEEVAGKQRSKQRGKTRSAGDPKGGKTRCTPVKACAKWCAAVYGADTPGAGVCTSQATKCRGMCGDAGSSCVDRPDPTTVCCTKTPDGGCDPTMPVGCCRGTDTCGGGGTPGTCGSCTPSCAGNTCGDDGCGGSCGTCSGSDTCGGGGTQGTCGCTPRCAGNTCGDDGCGGSCGTCAADQACASGTCSCTTTSAICDDSNFVPEACLAGCSLAAANLSGVDLSYATLTSANLNGANLNGATLTSANLTGATLNGATLNNGILWGVNLTNGILTNADLGGANLSRANLTGANLTGASLGGNDLFGTLFCNTTMPDGSINNAGCP
jgi:hypothetical protein